MNIDNKTYNGKNYLCSDIVKNIKSRKHKKNLQKQDVLFLLLIVLISVLLKLSILYTNSNLMSDEECWIGTIAKELIENPDLKYPRYSSLVSGTKFYSGRIIEAKIAAVMFNIFGVNGIVLKYTYLLLSTGISIAIFFFLFKFFGRKAAYIGILLLTFPFPVIKLSSLSIGGPYLLQTLVNILMIFCFFKIVKSKDLRYFVILASLSGFSLWISIYSIFMIMSMIFTWFLVDRKFIFDKKFYILILIIYIVASQIYYAGNDTNKDIIHAKFSDTKNKIINTGGIKNQISKFIIRDFYQTSFLPYYYTTEWNGYYEEEINKYYQVSFLNSNTFAFFLKIYWVSFIVIAFIFTIKSVKKPEMVYSLFLIITLLIIAVNGINIGRNLDSSRHLIEPYYIILLCCSIMLSKILRVKKYKTYAYVITGFILAMGVITNIGLIGKRQTIYYAPCCYDAIGYSYIIQESQKRGIIEVNDFCHEFDNTNYFDCMNGARYASYFDPKVSELCKYIDNRTKPFCYIPYINKFGSAEIKPLLADPDFSYLFENSTQKYFDQPWSRTYNDYYSEDKLNKCLKMDDKPNCITQVSYSLAYALGHAYLETENILCRKLPVNLKKYCYLGLGERIGEINFKNISKGYDECDFETGFDKICKERVCGKYLVYDLYKNLEMCKEFL